MSVSIRSALRASVPVCLECTDACDSLTTLYIGLSASVHIITRKSPFVSAARGRLLSVYPLMADSLGGLRYDDDRHAHAYKACDDSRSFLPESEGDRLVLRVEELGEEGKSTVRMRPRKVYRAE